MFPVLLDVGGTIFKTDRTTLQKSPFFDNPEFFSEAWQQTQDPKPSPIFVDCEPEGFRHVLEHLRCENYLVPVKYRYLCEHFGLRADACETLVSEYKNTIESAVNHLEIYLKMPDEDPMKTCKLFGLIDRLFCDRRLTDVFNNEIFIVAVSKLITNQNSANQSDPKKKMEQIQTGYTIIIDDKTEFISRGSEKASDLVLTCSEKSLIHDLHKICLRERFDWFMENYVLKFIQVLESTKNWNIIKELRFVTED